MCFWILWKICHNQTICYCLKSLFACWCQHFKSGRGLCGCAFVCCRSVIKFQLMLSTSCFCVRLFLCVHLCVTILIKRVEDLLKIVAPAPAKTTTTITQTANRLLKQRWLLLLFSFNCATTIPNTLLLPQVQIALRLQKWSSCWFFSTFSLVAVAFVVIVVIVTLMWNALKSFSHWC